MIKKENVNIEQEYNLKESLTLQIKIIKRIYYCVYIFYLYLLGEANIMW